jgi:mannose-6-phosphate isomerase-like protein (cupin superfamily)
MKMNISDKEFGKKPYVVDIEDATIQNETYRTTMWTGEKLQVTIMSIQPNDDIGLEVHHGIDQFIRIEEGQGVCKMGPTEDNLNFEQEVKDDDAVFVPADMWHNILNTGDKPLKLYTIYAGPDHVAGTIHETHEDARNDPNEQD